MKVNKKLSAMLASLCFAKKAVSFTECSRTSVCTRYSALLYSPW